MIKIRFRCAARRWSRLGRTGHISPEGPSPYHITSASVAAATDFSACSTRVPGSMRCRPFGTSTGISPSWTINDQDREPCRDDIERTVCAWPPSGLLFVTVQVHNRRKARCADH
jgi:hypothetical protein